MRGEDAYKAQFEHIELFDEPGLFTYGRINRETVPDGWFCYDLRGNDDDPNDPSTVEDRVAVNHAGSVIFPKPLDLREIDEAGTHYRTIGEGLNFLDEEITLEKFCKEYEIPFPERKLRYELRPIAPDELRLLGHDSEQTESYAVGYVRIDFGRNGNEFWSTWWPKNEDKFNTPAFKEALRDFIDDLRAVGPLRNRRAMEKYCSSHPDGKSNTWLGAVYGYYAETEHYRFCLRCDPRPGMYNCYLYARDLDEQRRLAKEIRFLQGSRELREQDISFSGEIMEMDGGLLNFCMECWFNVDEVFGTHVCTGDNDDYINVYANYDMVNERLCDALSITYWKGDSCEECEYRLSDEEKAMLLPAMNAYCKEQSGMDLKEYSAGAIAEQREPDAIRAPKRYTKQNRTER